MNIALYHNLTSGGSKREAYEFARQFVQHGHTVHLFAPKTADEEFLPLTKLAHRSFIFDLQLYQPLRGHLPFVRRYLDLVGLTRDLHRLQALAQKIAAQIDAGGYDFVFAHHDRIVQSPYLLRHLKTPSAYYCAEANHGVYESTILRSLSRSASRSARLAAWWYTPAGWAQYQILKTEDRKNLKAASALLTNSYFTAESLYRVYGVQARVSYLGVDVEKFRPLDLVRLYNQARAFIYAPILEPFGLVVLEAMACGTPVVAVKEGGVRESVIDGVTGWLIPRDPHIFADALGRLLSDEQLALTIGKAGREKVAAEFDPVKIAAKNLKVYEQAIERANA